MLDYSKEELIKTILKLEQEIKALKANNKKADVVDMNKFIKRC